MSHDREHHDTFYTGGVAPDRGDRLISEQEARAMHKEAVEEAARFRAAELRTAREAIEALRLLLGTTGFAAPEVHAERRGYAAEKLAAYDKVVGS